MFFFKNANATKKVTIDGSSADEVRVGEVDWFVEISSNEITSCFTRIEIESNRFGTDSMGRCQLKKNQQMAQLAHDTPTLLRSVDSVNVFI